MNFDALPPVGTGSAAPTLWWLARTHLRPRRATGFVSATTFLSIVAVIAGVTVLNCVIAVMAGFEEDLKGKILGTDAHIVVTRADRARFDPAPILAQASALPGVSTAVAGLRAEVMLRSPWGATGAVLEGLEPETSGGATELSETLVLGYDPAHQAILTYPEGDAGVRDGLLASLAAPFPPMGLDGAPLPPTPENGLVPGIVLGAELQEHLGVRPGDLLRIVNPLGGGAGPMGVQTPSLRSVRVAAVAKSGLFEHDLKWSWVAADVIRSLLRATGSDRVDLRLADVADTDRVARQLRAGLGPEWSLQTWKERDAALLSALTLEKWVFGLLLFMVVINAGLLILSTMVMGVATRAREIAILKAMGATSRAISGIFLLEGGVIGLLGTGVGTATGLLGCELIARYEYPLETDVYELATLPVVVEPGSVAVIAFAAFATCFVCTLLPAAQAGRLPPLDLLRYE